MKIAAQGMFMEIRARVLESTYASLNDTAERLGVIRPPGVKSGLGPLLDLIAAKIAEVSALLPQASSKKWRLSASQIRLIRVSTDKQQSIAAEYRVDPATISRIKAGKAYAWVK